MRILSIGAIVCALLTTNVSADDEQRGRQVVDALENAQICGLINTAIGVTYRERTVRGFVSDDDLDFETKKLRILLVGGLDDSPESVEATLAALRWFHEADEAQRWRDAYAVSAVPCVYLDALAGDSGPDELNAGRRELTQVFPPLDITAYDSQKYPERMYLWRWIGMHAPDLIVDVRADDRSRWQIGRTESKALLDVAGKLNASNEGVTADDFIEAVMREAPCEVGTVAAVRAILCHDAPDAQFLKDLLGALSDAGFSVPSAARVEMQRRLARTPIEVAEQLSQHYGHELPQVVYIPAMALVGRLRLGELTGDATHMRDVERIAAPYIRSERPTNPNSGSALSGHLIFSELAARTAGERRERYVELARVAADLAFDEQGRPKPSMPFHEEMSDSVFMGGPILSSVGKLTGDQRYFDACARHVRLMEKLVRRDDGLYRHSPLDEAAWGRGNGFPALGLAMCLTDFPADHPDRLYLLELFQQHMTELAQHQDPTGCWHQVIDKKGSYRELSCTCMITFAMIRGVRNGWLDAEAIEPAINRAWHAIRMRVPPDGRLVDVCTGTGKQKELRAYYDRPAILGPDARGGAMALLVATEMAAWKLEVDKGK